MTALLSKEEFIAKKRDELKRDIELNGLDEVISKIKLKKAEQKKVFSNIVNEWMEVYKKGKAKRSVTTTIQRLQKHILPIFKNKDISIISVIMAVMMFLLGITFTYKGGENE